MQYNKPYDQSNPDAAYVNGNPATSTAGSIPCAEGLEHPQREIVAVIKAAQAMGLDAPSATDLAQMLKAVRSGLLNRFPATGTPDAVAIAPQPVYLALVEGLRFRFKVPGAAGTANATTSPTFQVNALGAIPLKTRSGANPAVGDLVVGAVLEAEIWADGNARIMTALASDGGGNASTIYAATDAAPTHALRVASATNMMASTNGSNNKIAAFGAAVNGIADRIGFTPGTGRFPCLKAGNYAVFLSLDTNMAIGNYGQSLTVGINGSVISAFGQDPVCTTSAMFGPCFTSSGNIALGVGDYFEVFGGHNYGSPQNMPVKVYVKPDGV